MASVELCGLNKAFGATRVLVDIDLEIADGEFVVFVGPSGCGKSTLLRIIAGLDAPTGGEVRIGGARVNETSPAERGVAMVFQSYALYPHMSVADNLGFSLRMAGAPRARREAMVREAARVLDIEGLLGRKPRELSGGQRQRVAIGRAIVREPKVFLLDEPLSNLDAALRARMRFEFAALHQRLSATMIYVTHDQAEAMTLADKVVVLREGRIEQVGPPMDLYRRPRTLFVAAFLGSPAINLLPGELVGVDGAGAQVRLASGEVVRVAARCEGLKIGAPVTVGVRPEHLDPAAPANTVAATIRFVERLGASGYAYGVLAGAADELTWQLSPRSPARAGETVRLGMDAARAHLFDAAGLACPSAAAAEEPESGR